MKRRISITLKILGLLLSLGLLGLWLPASTAGGPLPALKGEAALNHLKEQKLYAPTWAQAVATIDVPGALNTFPFAINPEGEITGAYVDAQGRRRGFALDRNGFTTVDVPGAVITVGVSGINPAGQMVGAHVLPPVRGFLLDSGGFTTIEFEGGAETAATGINPKGEIVGRYRDLAGRNHGFLLRR